MVRLNTFIKICTAIILVLAIIYVGSLVNFIFKPLLSAITIITIPLMLSAFFYYLLRPLVNLLERNKVNRTFAVLLIYLAFAIVIAGFIVGVWPSLQTQLVNLVDNAPDLFNDLSDRLEEMQQSGFLSEYLPSDVNPLNDITNYLNKGFSFLTDYVSGLVSVISNIAVVLVVFPIVLFYMLKENGRFGRTLVHIFPKRFQGEVTEVIADIDHSLSNFIIGRVLINLALGVLMYVGFLIIGLPYALLLTVVAVIMNFIPFIGSILSSVPVVIIGFIESPSVAIWSLIVILVAQQIQDNVIAPYVFGKQLSIHPLTTIILVLVGGDIAGIIGILLIIPIYMIIKIISIKVYELFFKSKWEDA